MATKQVNETSGFTLAEGATHVGISHNIGGTLHRFVESSTHVGIFHITRRVAFTLAEVLITLGIIGIVSALTIPTLINNYQKKVTVTRLQQTYAMLNQALKMSQVNNGFMDTWKYPKEQSFEALETFMKEYILPYIKVSEICEKSSLNTCLHRDAYYLDGRITSYDETNSADDKYIMKLANGVYTTFRVAEKLTAVFITVDINGKPGPNTYGKDLFQLYIPYKVPFNSAAIGKCQQYGIYFRGAGFPRENLMHGLYDTAYNCNKKTNTYRTGVTCGALIQLDNWQIKDDYPW